MQRLQLFFFKNVQSNLHYAVSGFTPPEIIKSRANSKKEHMVYIAFCLNPKICTQY